MFDPGGEILKTERIVKTFEKGFKSTKTNILLLMGLKHLLKTNIKEKDSYVGVQAFFTKIDKMKIPRVPVVRQFMFKIGIAVNALGGAIPLPSCLFDSGALDFCYVNVNWFNRHKEELKGMISDTKGTVVLGDDMTALPITKQVVMTVVFRDNAGQPHELHSAFSVIPTGPDLVVGLPAIVFQLSDLFIEMLADARKELVEHRDKGDAVNSLWDTNTADDSVDADIDRSVDALSKDILQDINEYRRKHEIVYPEGDEVLVGGKEYLPWTNMLEIAPEEENTPVPQLFAGAIMEAVMNSKEKLMQDYFNMLGQRITKEWCDSCPEFLVYLKERAYKAFVQDNYDGIKGIDPIDFRYTQDKPESFCSKIKPIHPKRLAAAKKELFRMVDVGILEAIDRPRYASAMIDADKATDPFVRLCGGFHEHVNKYIVSEFVYVPHVVKSLERLKGWKYYIEIDWKHSFRQFLLSREASEYLTIITPWGAFRQRFLPEGVKVATTVLQTTVIKLFIDFEEWLLCIFDNAVILCNSAQDGLTKFKLFIERCIEHNIFLQFKKTNIGIQKISFFGYEADSQGYGLSDERKKALMEIPFPYGTPKVKKKRMQSILGFSQYFRDFVVEIVDGSKPFRTYSELTAPLSDMTRDSFNWDESTWKIDYRQVLEELKQWCNNALKCTYADFSLEWELYVDAAKRAHGGTLVQHRPNSDGSFRTEVIAIVSKKFSDAASRWDTIKRECYAIYHSVLSFAYYLRYKPFKVRTDHQNLTYMERSRVAIIMRWTQLLQSFPIASISHVKGKDNLLGDFWTRAGIDTLAEELKEEDEKNTIQVINISSALYPDVWTIRARKLGSINNLVNRENKIVNANVEVWCSQLEATHGGRRLHYGRGETWRRIKTEFPGTDCPYWFVCQWIDECIWCQKFRTSKPANRLEPLQLTVKVSGPRKRVGADLLQISPSDEDGNTYIYVFRNLFTNISAGYATKTKTAEDAANSLVCFVATYGLFEQLITDPGSDFTSEVVDLLNKYFGFKHHFSLVDRHESNGVEPLNKELIRHLRTIVAEERLQKKWGKPYVLQLIFAQLNGFSSSEYGVDAITATYGSVESEFFIRNLGIYPISKDIDMAHAYIRELDENKRAIQEGSLKYQQELIWKRTSRANSLPQTLWQAGDLVFVDNLHKDNKLQAKRLGPFQVIGQDKNEVRLENLLSHEEKVVHVSQVVLFEGNLHDAIQLAMRDNQQYKIETFLAFRGNPEIRTTVEFLILFEDGSEEWLVWSHELFTTKPYEDFCSKYVMLTPLLHSATEASRIISSINATPISEVTPGVHVFVDLRWESHTWYKQLSLPNLFTTKYVIEMVYQRFIGRKKKIVLYNPLFDKSYTVDHVFVRWYGMLFDLSTYTLGPVTVVDRTLCEKYPELLP